MFLSSHNLVFPLSFIFLILCGLQFASCSKSTYYISAEEEWMDEICSLNLRGRKTGTRECAKVADYIVKELEVMGCAPKIEEFSFCDSILMRNIIVEIPGSNDSIVVFGAHYDGAVTSSIHQAANDNASGVVALLSIAKNIPKSNYTILLCFWDGEENTSGYVFNGSRYFVSSYEYIDKVKWYCNFDTCGSNNDIVYLYYSESLANRFCDFYLSITKSYPLLSMRHGVQEYSRSDYVSFREVGIPIWGWSDKEYKLIHTPQDSKDVISIQKIKYVSSASLDILCY